MGTAGNQTLAHAEAGTEKCHSATEGARQAQAFGQARLFPVGFKQKVFPAQNVIAFHFSKTLWQYTP